MQFTEDQKKVIETRNKNILVSAAAGSGKTAVLVQRILSRITGKDPIDIDRLLIVTFTSAAAAEMREMQNKIDALREENSTFKSSAMTSQIVGQAVAPINAVLAGLQQEVAGIKCKMPETATVPYQPFVAVPNCVAAQYGLYGVNGANGFWG